MAREPTHEEWEDFHQMVRGAQQLLRKTPDGEYIPESIKAAKSGVDNALAWLAAIKR